MVQLLIGTDAGVTAVDNDASMRAELDGRAVTRLARDRDAWLAVADRRSVLRRDNTGAWTELVTIDGGSITSLLPQPGGAILGTSDARLLRLLDGAVAPMKAFDDIDGRDTWHAVGTKTPYVRALAATKRVLLAAVHVGGIPRSGNGGASWAPTIDVEADVHEVRADPSSSTRVMAAAARGLAVSTDDGKSWATETEGLHATYLRALAFATDAVLVSASEGPRGQRSAVYRRALDGGPFEQCRDGLPEWLSGNIDTGRLDAHRDDAAFADDDGVIHVSRDGGQSWADGATLTTPVHAVGVIATAMGA